MIIQPYLLVSKLIPQPTWGGQYIATFKALDQNIFGKLAIGQSYELATDSQLSTAGRSELLPIEIGNASDGQTQEVVGDRTTMFSLQSLIDQDHQAVLGKRVADAHDTMHILIKFTQAKGNSFQVHVMNGKNVGAWKPKPESWYFMEMGRATLGLKSPIDLEAYKKVCLEIEEESKKLEARIKGNEIQIQDARKALSEFITAHDPFAYVNVIDVPKDTIVDLSDGGIHHSWEEGEQIPQGNIVYEVQLNVMDKDCTLRSFDKGKIADDGSVRPVHVEEYFQALDVDPLHNDPASHMRQVIMHSDQGVETTQLFDSLFYKTSVFVVAGTYSGPHTLTDPSESFHHLFVAEGEIDFEAGQRQLHATKGTSIFVPASTGQYTLRTNTTAKIFQTWG